MDELILYLTGFWFFVFSSSFRAVWLAEFKAKKWGAKIFSIVGGLISATVGVGVPIIVVTVIFNHFNATITVDKCLDSGGSYNYDSCVCDYKQNHPYKETNNCR